MTSWKCGDLFTTLEISKTYYNQQSVFLNSISRIQTLGMAQIMEFTGLSPDEIEKL